MIINNITELKEQFNKASSKKYPFKLEISSVKPRTRTSSQNKMWQSISRQMAEFTGYSHAEMKLELQKNLLGVHEIEFTWKGNVETREVARETPDTESDEFSAFLSKVIAIANELGLDV